MSSVSRIIILSLAVGLTLLTSLVEVAAADTNYALQFDGSNDYARVVDLGNFDFSTSFTIEAWVKPASVAGTGLLTGLVSGRSSDNPNSSGGWVMYQPKGDRSQWGMSVCTPGCSAPLAPADSLVVDEWQHLAATYDGAEIHIYENGVLVGNQPQTGDVTDINYLFIGAWSGGFQGLLDEVRVWNVARTPEQIVSTMIASLQGDEPGLVAYWPFDDGAGQSATDASGNGQTARLGSTDGGDANDPAWVISDSPIIPPVFQLFPGLAGLGTDIGISSVIGPVFNCGWVPGETVEVWWDKPEAQLATFTAEANGCFEGMFRLDDDERIPGSEAGTHEVQARGSASGVLALPFEQVVPQLHLSPSEGPSLMEVQLTGCGWDGADTLTVAEYLTGKLLTRPTVDPGTGCIDDTMTIPRQKDGFFQMIATSAVGHYSAAAYWVQGATIVLTPNEGPAGVHVPLAGCDWFPEEQIEFAFTGDNVVFDTWGTSTAGCITTGGPTEPALFIPLTATLGAKTIRATGVDSGQIVNVPFTVIERSLTFAPDHGLPGDPIAVSGCGWVDNTQVTIEWGYPDTNNLPIRWLADADSNTGCFGLAGDFIINVPANTITGPVTETATGNTVGSITADFTVNHNGRIEIPTPDGYAAGTMTVNVFDAIVGETIFFNWDDGPAFDGVGAATSDFSYDITLPDFASIGGHVVVADGTKGFSDEALVNILDNAQIAVATAGDIYPGDVIRIDGTGWAAGEVIDFELHKGIEFWPVADSVTVATGNTDFSELLSLPTQLPAGDFSLQAVGNKGREATTNLTLKAAPSAVFSLAARFADAAPRLDGSLAKGEWDYAQKAVFANGFITAQSDDSRLYILLDMLGDTDADPLGTDNFWLSFDLWNNQQIDAGWDLNFRLDGAGDFIVEEYDGPNSFSPRNSVNLRSAYGAGFYCGLADGSLGLVFDGFIPKFNCSRHRVWEIAIDLHTIDAAPGDVVRLGVRSVSQSPAYSEDNPPGFSSDFSELGAISLAASQLDPNPPSGTLSGIGSNGFEIEVTQAVQDVDNSLHLVARKDTVVRVYPEVQDEVLVRAYLFGRRNGLDLPGSPLVTLATVPPSINRETLTHTANFLLPSSWTMDGITDMLTIVESLDGQTVQAAQEAVVFYERRIPEIWVYPFNLGSQGTPILPLDAHMLEQEQVLQRLLPTPDVKISRRSWAELGQALNTVACPAVSTVGNMDSNLDPGEDLTCSFTYKITDGDIKRGSFPRSAIAAGDGGRVLSEVKGITVDGPPDGNAAPNSERTANRRQPGVDSFSSVSGLPLNPAGAELQLTLSSAESSFNKTGDIINYTYLVESVGSTTVEGPVVVGDSEIGIDFTQMKRELSRTWNSILQAKVMSNDTASMPDQLFGFKVLADPGAVGTSSPVYSGGLGHVVVGQANGSDFNTTTMIHETNHNLDRSSTGTWGRHVADPQDIESKNWGCGASGPDSAWPYDGTDNVQEVGFDTTMPWTGGDGQHLTVVPDTRDDFMSYCWKKRTPIQWISPYRWQAMFSRFPVISPVAAAGEVVVDTVYYISGQLNADGSGSLDPVQILPGVASTDVAPGEYSIEVLDGGDIVLSTLSFTAWLTDVEGVELDSVYFSFQIPDQPGAAAIVLKHNGQELDRIVRSPNPPTAEVVAPVNGDSWSDEATIQWTADDADGDSLVFSLFFSPNAGVDWYPVASELSGFEYTVAVDTLPGGEGGRVMLFVSDGFNTTQVESGGAFRVPYPAPTVIITTPVDGQAFAPGAWIDLSGSASDPAGMAAEAFTYVWSIDGEPAEIGSEAMVSLEEGLHTIVLDAYDSQGNHGVASVIVNSTLNSPPNLPANPTPAEAATNVPVSSALSWSGGDPDGDPVVYDVYLEADSDTPEVLVCTGNSSTTCVLPGNLLPFSAYYWQVVARDNSDASRSGPVWSFETGPAVFEEVIFSNGFE